jgi:hypothetical protein
MAYTTIDKPSKYFDVKLRQGFSSSGGTVTGLSFKPEMFWEKNRTSTTGSGTYVYDVVRGVYKFIRTNLTDAEATNTNLMTSFNSDGFTLGSSDYATDQSLVAWCWSAGNSTGVSNTAGDIASTVSANTTSGFSIVKYTGNGTSGATIGHGLSVKPNMIILKSYENGQQWAVYHSSLGATQGLRLNSTIAAYTSSTRWNNTEPTSTLFTVGNDGEVNTSGEDQIAYCFAEKKGFSKFGKYTGNGSATDGTFVYTGFKPRFIMIKGTTLASSWVMFDTVRSTINPVPITGGFLLANVSNAEAGTGDSAAYIDILSNGFKIRNNSGFDNNSGSDTYIYMCFAENPFVTSTSVPTTAR